MKRNAMTSLLCGLTAIAVIAGLCGCRDEHTSGKTEGRNSGFEQFVPVYNRYITRWVGEQRTHTLAEMDKVRERIAKAADETQRERAQSQLNSLQRELEKWDYRLSLGDYLRPSCKDPLPADLKWEDGMEQPEIGDPRAVKGGVFTRSIEAFPPTIRPFGNNSNNSFRGDLYDYIDMTLVGLHPMTMQIIPGVARQWAVSADGRTIYFRLHPEARYSDNTPVHASHYLFDCYLRVSDHIVNPYSKQYYRENFAQMTVYDEHTLAVTLPEAKYLAPAMAGSLTPSAPHFYQEYGSDYDERFQWRFPPTTGAYEVLPDDIVKGVSITQTRVKNWWAKDLKFYRHRYNPDKVVHVVVRDESKAFELFRAGQHDSFLITRSDLWYEKSEVEPVYKGYIERVTFYNRYPKIPRGLYLNVIKPPIDNRDVRIGINHAMNWQKVIDVMFRGDAQLLNGFNEGYEHFSDPNLRARPYSIQEARRSFAAAGYDREDSDGILRKADGTRLSVSVTYPATPIYDRLLSILREDAKACGLELRLDGLEATVSFKKLIDKQHQMAVSGWMITPPIPDYYQYLHSSNAFDDKGNPKPQTNNVFSWARADTDQLCEQARNACTLEELRDANLKLQHIMHDEAIFIPAYSVDFTRIGFWRWVRWPDCETTRFSAPVVYDPHEIFVFWIDENIRRETQQAMRTGRSFPETTRTVDAYRIRPKTTESAPQPPSEPQPPPTPGPVPSR
ncbi:MAG TPA: ABC transporter substrate-binding protein [Luteolibacter sp.]|nr:ABC transporter substrate-binding protein [Luteolibacter sp.]